jgi:hypothetical protein
MGPTMSLCVDNAHIFFASPSTTMFTSADMKQNETLSCAYYLAAF